MSLLKDYLQWYWILLPFIDNTAPILLPPLPFWRCLPLLAAWSLRPPIMVLPWVIWDICDWLSDWRGGGGGGIDAPIGAGGSEYDVAPCTWTDWTGGAGCGYEAYDPTVLTWLGTTDAFPKQSVDRLAIVRSARCLVYSALSLSNLSLAASGSCWYVWGSK